MSTDLEVVAHVVVQVRLSRKPLGTEVTGKVQDFQVDPPDVAVQDVPTLSAFTQAISRRPFLT